jgi:hypothetical protein
MAGSRVVKEKSSDEMREVAEKVYWLFRERLEVLLSDPDVVSRILSGSSPAEEWGIYLNGLAAHGVRRLGRMSFTDTFIPKIVVGVGSDEIVVDDPLMTAGPTRIIVVPRDFAFRMVVLGGLP